jgi:hypothetical protein
MACFVSIVLSSVDKALPNRLPVLAAVSVASLVCAAVYAWLLRQGRVLGWFLLSIVMPISHNVLVWSFTARNVFENVPWAGNSWWFLQVSGPVIFALVFLIALPELLFQREADQRRRWLFFLHRTLLGTMSDMWSGTGVFLPTRNLASCALGIFVAGLSFGMSTLKAREQRQFVLRVKAGNEPLYRVEASERGVDVLVRQAQDDYRVAAVASELVAEIDADAGVLNAIGQGEEPTDD